MEETSVVIAAEASSAGILCCAWIGDSRNATEFPQLILTPIHPTPTLLFTPLFIIAERGVHPVLTGLLLLWLDDADHRAAALFSFFALTHTNSCCWYCREGCTFCTCWTPTPMAG